MHLFRNAPDARVIEAGTYVCRQGETGTTMFAVVEGDLEVVHDGEVIERIGAGETFGEMSLVDKSPRSADVRAATQCRVVEIDERRFGFLVQQNPFFALEIMRTLSKRLRHRIERG
jgi:CRP-like cAMP-binding protein